MFHFLQFENPNIASSLQPHRKELDISRLGEGGQLALSDKPDVKNQSNPIFTHSLTENRRAFYTVRFTSSVTREEFGPLSMKIANCNQPGSQPGRISRLLLGTAVFIITAHLFNARGYAVSSLDKSFITHLSIEYQTRGLRLFLSCRYSSSLAPKTCTLLHHLDKLMIGFR